MSAWLGVMGAVLAVGPQVGEWVTFQTQGGPERSAFIRMAVVGEEPDAQSGSALWIEIEVGEHPAFASPLLQARLLCARGWELTGAGVRRAYVGIGTERLAEVRPDDVPRIFRQVSAEGIVSPERNGSSVALVRGEERPLMTAVGTVRARPLSAYIHHTLVQRIWLSDEVPILRTARWELPSIGYRMDVREMGLGAKSRMVVPVGADKPVVGLR